MAINLTDALNAATTKGKLADAKQVYLNGDTKNLQQTYEETSTHFGTLDNRSTQMEKAIQDISATGGASTANAVSYNNSTSKLEAITSQGAIDELATKKLDKESILQESGEAEDKVMSQKATTTAIADETTRAKVAEEAIIYDVSAHNSGVVFESLSALLSSSNLSTLIPTSVRHGGMSIKFIKSIPAIYFVTKTDGVEKIPSGGIELESASLIVTGVYNSTELDDFSTLPADIGNSTKYYYAVSGETTTYTTWKIVKWFGQSKKYVQYHLMNTSWSTNVNDWQDYGNVMIDSKNLTSSEISKDGYQLVRHLVNSCYEDGTTAISASNFFNIYDIYPNSIIDSLIMMSPYWDLTFGFVRLYDSNFKCVKEFNFKEGTLVGNNYYRLVVNTDDYNDVTYFSVRGESFLYLDIYRKNIMPSVDYLSNVKLIYNPTTYLNQLDSTSGSYDVALLNDTTIRNMFKLSSADLAVIGSNILYLYCNVPVGQYQGSLGVTDGTNSISNLKPINYSKFRDYTYKSEVFFIVDISSLNKENGLVFTINNFRGGDVRMFTHKWDNINSVPVAPDKKVRGLYEIYDNFSWTPNTTFPTIYDAINAVKEGGTLILPTGTYPVKSFSASIPSICINKDITIEGSRDTRILGGHLISEAEQYNSNADVYVTDINSAEYGYAKNDYFWIYQDGIADSYTAVVAKEMTEKYHKRTHRLPYCTRLWNVGSIEAVVNATRPSWYVDTTNNKLYFRAVTGSNISQNPIVVARDEFDHDYGHENNTALYISPLVKNITLRNLKIMYGKLMVGAVGKLTAENVEIIGVTGVSAGLGFAPSAKRARFIRCEVAGCAGDAVSGGTFNGPMGGRDYYFTPAKPFVSGVQIVLDSIWVHDNADDGITEHGTFSWQIKDSLIEYNGVSGSTVAGGDSDYINCIFRKNAWKSIERGGFQNMANDDNGHCTLINCVGIDNYASADFLVRATTGKQSYTTFIGCKSVQTEDKASISYGYDGINPADVKGFLCDSGSSNHMICSDCTSNRNTPVQKGASSDVKIINGSPLVIE